jgi:hypothetical protein
MVFGKLRKLSGLTTFLAQVFSLPSSFVSPIFFLARLSTTATARLLPRLPRLLLSSLSHCRSFTSSLSPIN